MTNSQQFSYLLWDDPSNIPFPEEMKYHLEKIDWTTFQWIIFNLPIIGSVFHMLDGKVLYLNSLPNGDPKVERQVFTGEIIIGHFFVDDNKEGDNFFLTFQVTIIDGNVSDIKRQECIRSPAKDFYDAEEKASQIRQRQNSWWYKFFYSPWKFLVRNMAQMIMIILGIVEYFVVKIANFLSPI